MSSWNYNLFFRVNQLIGKHKLFDRLMTFCAHDLIYLLFFFTFLWAATALFQKRPDEFDEYVKLLLTAGLFGFITSWAIGIVHPHVRPIREFPYVKQLLKPFGSWKSFPSDHTIASFTLALITLFVGAPLWFALALVGAAFFISIARVYAGAHYPID